MWSFFQHLSGQTHRFKTNIWPQGNVFYISIYRRKVFETTFRNVFAERDHVGGLGQNLSIAESRLSLPTKKEWFFLSVTVHRLFHHIWFLYALAFIVEKQMLKEKVTKKKCESHFQNISYMCSTKNVTKMTSCTR